MISIEIRIERTNVNTFKWLLFINGNQVASSKEYETEVVAINVITNVLTAIGAHSVVMINTEGKEIDWQSPHENEAPIRTILGGQPQNQDGGSTMASPDEVGALHFAMVLAGINVPINVAHYVLNLYKHQQEFGDEMPLAMVKELFSISFPPQSKKGP